MKKRNSKHEKRVKKLIVGSMLCAIILTVSTYAWFIGMKTVNIAAFEVDIAAIKGLQLSLNGEDWADTVHINGDNYSTVNDSNNTNSWGKALVPMSTIGTINATSSRLVLFEKGSFTATPGGYRLMASLVENAGSTEKDGYVAFDLFVKNESGPEYYSTLNVLNEEAIYLTTESIVKVATGGVKNTGIENSVRVAFAQIGRVKATTETQSIITGITCTSDANVTGICENRPAQIWEPNDVYHVANAINWYNTSCLKRTGDTVIATSSYDGSCTTIADGTAYTTYAISDVVDYTDEVNAYDGYNSYFKTIKSDANPTGKLVGVDTFTDTEKYKEGTDRPEFITLAPNSITKIRIYVYLEGQDVDNYDFASLGKKISVAFGLTKERYVDTDVEYDPSGTAELPEDVKQKSTATE